MSNDSNVKTIVLEDNLSFASLEKLHELLNKHRGESVSLDASNVQNISGLCLQLLLSSQKSWVAEDLKFEITEQSPAFEAALSSAGISVSTFAA